MLSAGSLLVASIALQACLVRAGSLWPLPKNQTTSGEVFYLSPDEFSFESTGYESDILQEAFTRYLDQIFNIPSFETQQEADIQRIKHLDAPIDALHVYVQSSDQSLNLETDESYTLIVQSPQSLITASTVYGALRGLETFSQLVDRIELPKQQELAGSLTSRRRLSAADYGAILDLGGQGVQAFIDAIGENTEDVTESINLVMGVGEDAGHREDAGYQEDDEDDGPHDDWKDDEPRVSIQDDAEQQEIDDFDSSGGRDFGEDADEDGKSSNHHHHHHKHHHHKHHHHRRSKSKTLYIVNATAISDEPRYKHRGLLIDTSRHFLPIDLIKGHLDAMAASKMNVLHWHLVDDQSFPMVSERLPLLSLMGAFSPSHTYTREEMEDIISYARLRGIRVLPEIDTPGHTLSWGAGYPDLLTDCYDKDGRRTGAKGPMDPTRNETYGTLWRLLQEIVEIFPDAYLHLGGDEVPFDCWQSNSNISSWMKEANIGSYPALEAYFEKRVLGLTAAAGRFPIVWQDVLDKGFNLDAYTVGHTWPWCFELCRHKIDKVKSNCECSMDVLDNGVDMDASTIAHVWKWWFDPSKHQGALASGNQSRPRPAICSLSQGCGNPSSDSGSNDETPGWMHELAAVTSKGHRALLSAPWYLDVGSYAGQDWKKYYQVDPGAFTEDAAQQALLVGGEAAMWGEYTDMTNAIPKTWPRAAAIAERLWSEVTPAAADQLERVEARLHHHRCRLLAMGLDAEPLGPGYCPQDVM